MFGKSAIQHAPKGSYPPYFRNVFEKALKESTLGENYFLHHIFLGHYIDHPKTLPIYLQSRQSNFNFDMIHGYLKDVPHIHLFDYVMLSNI